MLYELGNGILLRHHTNLLDTNLNDNENIDGLNFSWYEVKKFIGTVLGAFVNNMLAKIGFRCDDK